MPSIFSHAFSAIAVGSCLPLKKNSGKTLTIGAACSMLPDADVISFAFGIPYSSLWGHRGITHSFFFAALLSLIIVLTFYRQSTGRNRYVLLIYFFLATAIHPILDACTNGGLGVAFFAPFTSERYFFSFRPIRVSPIGAVNFFSERGWAVFKSEFVWVWLPSIGIIGGIALWRRLLGIGKSK